MATIEKPSSKHTIVLSVNGSLNMIVLSTVNMIMPIEKPSNLLGHISPSKDLIKYSTDFT